MKSGILIGHFKDKGNEGGLLRTAEAFGINLAFVLGKKQSEYRTSQGSDRHIVYFEFETISDFISYVKRNNHSIVCIENIENAKSISEVRKYPKNPIFVTGNEMLGVDKQLLDNANLIVKIEQANSYTNCLNTSVAGAIVIRDFYNKFNEKRKELWKIGCRKRKTE